MALWRNATVLAAGVAGTAAARTEAGEHRRAGGRGQSDQRKPRGGVPGLGERAAGGRLPGIGLLAVVVGARDGGRAAGPVVGR